MLRPRARSRRTSWASTAPSPPYARGSALAPHIRPSSAGWPCGPRCPSPTWGARPMHVASIGDCARVWQTCRVACRGCVPHHHHQRLVFRGGAWCGQGCYLVREIPGYGAAVSGYLNTRYPGISAPEAYELPHRRLPRKRSTEHQPELRCTAPSWYSHKCASVRFGRPSGGSTAAPRQRTTRDG